MRKTIISLIVAFTFFIQVYGAGFNLFEHSASGAALGGAVVAHPYDISTIFYNPGGLAFFDGQNFYGGATIIRPGNKFIGASPTYEKNIHSTVSHTFASLGIYYAYKFNDKLAAGIGITNPYGLAIEWEDDFPGNHLSRYTDLKSFYISPVISYKINENLSIGGGADIVYSTVTLEKYARMSGINYDIGKVELEGNNGFAYGFTFGMMYKTPKLGIGFMYRHSVENKYDNGKAKFTLFDTPAKAAAAGLLKDQDVKTGITFPANLSAGIYYQATEKLGIEVDYVWFKWDVFDKLEMDFAEGEALDQEIEEGYENSSQIRFGLNYQVNPNLSLRAGYAFDKTPQPTESVSPLLPDNDRNDYSFGLSYKMNNMNFDLGYMLVGFSQRSTLENRVGVNHEGFNGEYSGLAHLYLFSFGYSF